MRDKIQEIKKRHEELSGLLGSEQVLNNQVQFQTEQKEYGRLAKIMEKIREFEKIGEKIEQTEQILEEADEQLKELAQQELAELKQKRNVLNDELKIIFGAKDKNKEDSIFLEIRAGTGGEEASLFVADLARMYGRYAQSQGWKVERMSEHSTGLGGYKEIIFNIIGKTAWAKLQRESGVHRVQRVPQTESSGRIHTSTVTVAVLPEPEEVEVKIKPEDLKIDVFRASGPGGQHVNVTDSAVRMTHLPTGVVVQCQDERSQLKNKEKALKMLKLRIWESERKRQEQEFSQQRRSQIGTAERSEKIRTYNFSQDRLTDHRLNRNFHNLEEILEGKIDKIIDDLVSLKDEGQ